jgi:hypothetical protein
MYLAAFQCVDSLDNFRSESASASILRIWYAIFQIRWIWEQIRILFMWISDGYGRGYGIVIIRRIWIIRHFLRIIRPSLLG